MSSETAVSLQDVTAGYKKALTFSHLTLDIQKGIFAGIVGPTGSGKTTFLKTILGTHPSFAGSIKVFDNDIGSSPAGTIGYVPQLETVDWSFPVTVEQVILMGLYAQSRLWPWPTKEDRHKVHHLSIKLGIHDVLHHHIVNISGGQQQRAFLARALIGNPRLLILDEPTSGVDIKTQHDILHLLGDLNDEGITILLTTHDLNAVASHLPWVICFNKGLIAHGKPREVFTTETLKNTYGGEMIIVEHEGHFLIANNTPIN
ncbi:MAG: metal ABC transporter ATP-binding protein [Gammaproteobacteria bacterium]